MKGKETTPHRVRLGRSRQNSCCFHLGADDDSKSITMMMHVPQLHSANWAYPAKIDRLEDTLGYVYLADS